MIIISQSCKTIINFDNLLGVAVSSTCDNSVFKIVAFPRNYEYADQQVDLGVYKEYNYAKKVLNDIVAAYINNCYFYMPDDF